MLLRLGRSVAARGSVARAGPARSLARRGLAEHWSEKNAKRGEELLKQAGEGADDDEEEEEVPTLWRPEGVSEEEHEAFLEKIAGLTAQARVNRICGRAKTKDPKKLAEEIEYYKKAVSGLQAEVREHITNQDYERALAVAEELKAMATEAYGETRNPILAAARNDRGMANKGLGYYEFAVRDFAEAVKMYDSCGLREHGPTATALHNLGTCYKDNALNAQSSLDRGILLDRAIEALDESVLRRKGRAYEEARDGPALATTQVVIASCLRMRKNPEEAEAMMRDAVFRLRQAHVDAPSSVEAKTALAVALNNQALYASKDGKETKVAEQLFAEALQLRESVFPKTHPLVIATLHNLAEHLLSLKDPDKDEAGFKIQQLILDRLGVVDNWDPAKDGPQKKKNVTVFTKKNKPQAQ